MAKKAKKKEGEVAKDRKESKVVKKVEVKESNSVLTLATFVSLVAFAVLCAIAYNIYADVVYVPEMPTFDLNKSWGPNTTEPQDTSIRPYRIVFSDSMNLEIRWLFEMYRRREMQESFNDTAWTYGVHSDAFDKLFDYWIFRYDFAKREKFLNQFEQYRTKIQGLDIHYIHVKPKVEVNVKVLPLLLLHGWPGSIREFYEVIPLLTTERPGYNFVFEVIIPSLPGFGFSQAPVRPGLSPHQIAIIMRNLMQRLGHKQYYVQGGNIGHLIGSHMATIFPKEVVGFHTNFPVNFSKYAQWVWVLGTIWPTLVANEYVDRMYPLDKKVNFYLEEIGFLHLQGTKPDTIGIALQDSPAGLASYILDRMMIFTNPANKLDPDGGMKKYYTYDQLLDNIMLYWVSGSITTSMRIYKEIFEDSETEKIIELIPTTVPTWGARFKNDLAYTPDFLLKWKYPNLLGTSNYNVGGHLAAFERPKEFSESIFQAAKAFLAFSK